MKLSLMKVSNNLMFFFLAVRRVTLKTNSDGAIKNSWEKEVIKAEEELLILKDIISVADLPENALLSFYLKVLL